MASALEWQPNTVYSLGAVIITPGGRFMRCSNGHTSPNTYNDANWVPAGDAGTTGLAPTAAAAAGMGTTPPAITVVGDDIKGNISFGTGTVPAAGTMMTVTFSRAMEGSNTTVVISPANAATAALQPFVADVSSTGFSVGLGVAPAASQAGTVYKFNYQVQM